MHHIQLNDWPTDLSTDWLIYWLTNSIQFFIHLKPVYWYLRFIMSIHKWTQKQSRSRCTVVVIMIKTLSLQYNRLYVFVFDQLTDLTINRLTDSPIVWLADWLIGRPTDWTIVSLSLNDWLIDRLTDLIDQLTNLPITDCLLAWLIDE